MPRKARLHSNTGIYHIMLRGVNRQQIFFDEEDYYHFIDLLEHYKRACGFRLYAFCLMGNHIHLLIRIGEEPLETIFRRIGSAYVYWYNGKYERTGHLFQDRFKSEAVDNEQYFFSVLRYILRNPVKAGLCRSPEEYPYSSGVEYFLFESRNENIGHIYSFSNKQTLKDYVCTDNDDECMELSETMRKRDSDKTASEKIIKEFGTLQLLSEGIKDRTAFYDSIYRLNKSGVSVRQMSRLTGLSRKVIENGLRKTDY